MRKQAVLYQRRRTKFREFTSSVSSMCHMKQYEANVGAQASILALSQYPVPVRNHTLYIMLREYQMLTDRQRLPPLNWTWPRNWPVTLLSLKTAIILSQAEADTQNRLLPQPLPAVMHFSSSFRTSYRNHSLLNCVKPS